VYIIFSKLQTESKSSWKSLLIQCAGAVGTGVKGRGVLVVGVDTCPRMVRCWRFNLVCHLTPECPTRRFGPPPLTLALPGGRSHCSMINGHLTLHICAVNGSWKGWRKRWSLGEKHNTPKKNCKISDNKFIKNQKHHQLPTRLPYKKPLSVWIKKWHSKNKVFLINFFYIIIIKHIRFLELLKSIFL